MPAPVYNSWSCLCWLSERIKSVPRAERSAAPRSSGATQLGPSPAKAGETGMQDRTPGTPCDLKRDQPHSGQESE